MPEEEARSMLRLIEERTRDSEIEVRHRDVLIRLRAMIEDDLAGTAERPNESQERQPASLQS